METTTQSQKSQKAKWTFRKRSVDNLLRMGHCAPTVMQTLLDVSGVHNEWLVKLSAGMPGGIGNTGFECGAMTSPLVLLGLRHGLRAADGGLPVIFDQGHTHCRQFVACHKTLLCRQIRQKDRFPRHCIPPVCLSPELFVDALMNHEGNAIPAEARAAYCRLYLHLAEQHFHCAQAVLERVPTPSADRQQVFDAASAFMGGTLFMGMTCSAFTAGVMAVGLRTAEIENSWARVIRLILTMTTGGNPFDEKLNKFNRSMNAGYRMSKWFAKEFGTTQCRAITQCDFSSMAGVNKYIEGDCVTRCKGIAEKVAERVRTTLAELEAIPSVAPARGASSPSET